MSGPNGELCSTCYYYDSEEGRCRVIAPQLARTSGAGSLAGYAQGAPRWPRVHGNDWCGQWLESATATAGFSATGAYVTPRDTNFSITDATNWVKYDPGNLLDGAIMDNVTLTNGTLTWSIPGNPPAGAEWEALVSVYGSVTFPTANTFLEITAGTDGVPYSANTLQRLEVNPTTDGLSLPWSLQGIAPATQDGSTEVLMRGDIGNASFTSAAFQIRVRRRK